MRQLEKHLLQVAVAAGSAVPIGAGVLGICLGAGMVGRGGFVTLDSHMRYLSGLLLGLGLAFSSTIPAIEKNGARFSLLSAIVVLGGASRLLGVLVDGWPAGTMIFGLGMELVVVPLLWLWQRRLAGRPSG